MSSGRAAEIAARPPEQPTLEELRKRHGTGTDDDLLILKALIPPSDIEAMQAAGPPRRDYPFTSPEIEQIQALMATARGTYVALETEHHGARAAPAMSVETAVGVGPSRIEVAYERFGDPRAARAARDGPWHADHRLGRGLLRGARRPRLPRRSASTTATSASRRTSPTRRRPTWSRRSCAATPRRRLHAVRHGRGQRRAARRARPRERARRRRLDGRHDRPDDGDRAPRARALARPRSCPPPATAASASPRRGAAGAPGAAAPRPARRRSTARWRSSG